MFISELAIKKIKEFEGCKLQAYQDAAGVWTIGYGHTYNVREGDRISQWYADDMTQEQLDAVVSFVFNLGIRRWQYSTLRRYIMLGKSKDKIRAEWMRWVHAGGKRLAGLVKRRQWECNRFFE